MKYVAPWWLPGGNLQTIWPALYARRVTGAPPQYRRERWAAPEMRHGEGDATLSAPVGKGFCIVAAGGAFQPMEQHQQGAV